MGRGEKNSTNDNSTQPWNAPAEYNSEHDSDFVTKGSQRKWYQWHEPGTSRAEKILLQKLDWSILLFVSLSFFIKSLDQSNVTNAYVSGMQKDLHLKANELNWFTTYYNIGIIIGAPIIMLVLTKIPPGLVLSTCIGATSLFVLFIYKAQSAETVYILRFFAGLFNAGVIPGSFYIIGTWYTKQEISRRSVLSMISFYGGTMFSGYIQTGLYEHMNGVQGLAAWRWLFIFDAIIGIPVAVFGFVFCPNAPRAKKPWFLTEKESYIAIERVTRDGREEKEPFQWPGTIVKIIKSWQFYCFPVCYAMLLTTCGVLAYQWTALYLKYTKLAHYSQAQINDIPTSVPGAIIFTCLVSGILADWLGNIAVVIFGLGLIMIFGFSVLFVFPANNSFLLAAYVLTGASYGAIFPLQTAWANISCGGNRHLRAITTAMMSTLGYIFETLAQQHYFPASDAPTYKKVDGFGWGLGWAVATVVFTCFCIPAVEAVVRRWRSRHDIERPATSSGTFQTSQPAETYQGSAAFAT